MPSVMIYVKQQDYDKWLAIEKKSEFIHNALNGITMDIHPEMHAQPSVHYPQPRPPSKVGGHWNTMPAVQAPEKVERNDEVFGSLNPDNLVFTGDAVYDKTTGEREEVTPNG